MLLTLLLNSIVQLNECTTHFPRTRSFLHIFQFPIQVKRNSLTQENQFENLHLHSFKIQVLAPRNFYLSSFQHRSFSSSHHLHGYTLYNGQPIVFLDFPFGCQAYQTIVGKDNMVQPLHIDYGIFLSHSFPSHYRLFRRGKFIQHYKSTPYEPHFISMLQNITYLTCIIESQKNSQFQFSSSSLKRI